MSLVCGYIDITADVGDLCNLHALDKNVQHENVFPYQSHFTVAIETSLIEVTSNQITLNQKLMTESIQQVSCDTQP